MLPARLRSKRAPYYIFAPGWTYKSSGVKCLHLLVHELWEKGERAYIVPSDGVGLTHPELKGGLLSGAIAKFYEEEGIEPIIIYPDVVKGNPLNGRKIVRWLLAPAGAYGGQKIFDKGEKVYGGRSDIHEPVLCLPTHDSWVFKLPDGGVLSGACYYAHKYDKIWGGKLLEVTAGATRLEGSPEEIAKVMQEAEVCYMYEVGEIATLAGLCGCRVEWVENEKLEKVDLLRWDFAIRHPEDTGKDVKDWWSRFWGQLDRFIIDTQNWECG